MLNIVGWVCFPFIFVISGSKIAIRSFIKSQVNITSIPVALIGWRAVRNVAIKKYYIPRICFKHHIFIICPINRSALGKRLPLIFHKRPLIIT